MKSAIVVASSKQRIAFSPMRPIDLQIAAARDADHQRREQQGRDDHLDHAQEHVGQRLDRDADARARDSQSGCPRSRPMKICVVSDGPRKGRARLSMVGTAGAADIDRVYWKAQGKG